MTRMSRLYPWLALGATTTSIGIGLIVHGGAWQLKVGEVFLLFAGAVLASGISLELVWPFGKWLFGLHGRFERAIATRIKGGETLLRQAGEVTQSQHEEWVFETSMMLGSYLGGEYCHEEIDRFEIAAEEESSPFAEAQYNHSIRRQIKVLREIVHASKEQQILIQHKRK